MPLELQATFQAASNMPRDTSLQLYINTKAFCVKGDCDESATKLPKSSNQVSETFELPQTMSKLGTRSIKLTEDGVTKDTILDKSQICIIEIAVHDNTDNSLTLDKTYVT
jgi:hypothetical protein